MPSSRPNISAAIICLNEAENIASCIGALQWCDEIVVVDSGSTDGTCEIVRSMPRTRLITRRFDTYINQKNFANARCNNDWVISVDADEIITEALQDEILSQSFTASAYQFRRRTLLGNREIKFGNWNPDFVTRLYHRAVCHWGGTNPHETVITSAPIARLSATMLHYSYDSRRDYADRSRRYAMMLADHLSGLGISSTRTQAWLHGMAHFAKAYLLRRGIFDGGDGLFLAWHGAKASFLKHQRLAYAAMTRRNEQATGETNLRQRNATDATLCRNA